MTTRSGMGMPALRAAYAASKLVYRGYKAYRSLRGSKSNGQSNRVSYGGVTTQRDSRLVYRYKRMPRRKRRAWTRFLRKNLAADLKNVGTKTIIYNGSTPLTTTGDQKQSVAAVHLYGCSPENVPVVSTEIGLADLRRIINQDIDTGAASDKAYFASAIMDITMTNISPPVTLPDTGASVNPPLEVDLYDIVYRKEIDTNSLQEFFNGCTNATIPITSGGSWTDVSQRGWTPFDTTQALALGGIKILRKTKYFVPYGDSVTYQVRDPRNRMFRRQDVYNDTKTIGFLSPGARATRSVLVVCKPVAGIAPGSGTTSFLKIGATRKYSYKIMKENADERYGAFQN